MVDVGAQSLNAEYRQSPTERNYERLELKAQVLQRLKSQLSSSSAPTVGDHQDVSSYWHCGIVCGAGSMQLSDIHPSVCPIRLPHANAAGLLLWARRPGYIDKLLHGQQSVAAELPHCKPRDVAKHRLVCCVYSRSYFCSVVHCQIVCYILCSSVHLALQLLHSHYVNVAKFFYHQIFFFTTEWR